jgi:hypothetical protein
MTPPGVPLCYCGELAAAFITLTTGPVGWCRNHLQSVGTWPATYFREAYE